MKFKDSKDLKSEGEEIGLAVISKLSSIRAFSLMGLPLEAMIHIENLIRGIECTCWSIMPLGLEMKKNSADFEKQLKQLDHMIEAFKKAASAMAEMSKFMSENESCKK